MSRPDKLSFLSPLIVLCIAAVFAYLVVSIIYHPGLASTIVTLLICILAVLFYGTLMLVGAILSVVMLSDRIHYYAVMREKREIERHLKRRQALEQRHHRFRNDYNYIPRRPQIKRIPLDDQANNGC